MQREQIMSEVTRILAEEFEADPAKISPTTNLFTDLDLDSIDAVELAIKLQKLTGKRVTPESFKHIRTVEDVVNAAEALLAQVDG